MRIAQNTKYWLLQMHYWESQFETSINYGLNFSELIESRNLTQNGTGIKYDEEINTELLQAKLHKTITSICFLFIWLVRTESVD